MSLQSHHHMLITWHSYQMQIQSLLSGPGYGTVDESVNMIYNNIRSYGPLMGSNNKSLSGRKAKERGGNIQKAGSSMRSAEMAVSGSRLAGSAQIHLLLLLLLPPPRLEKEDTHTHIRTHTPLWYPSPRQVPPAAYFVRIAIMGRNPPKRIGTPSSQCFSPH